MPRCSAQLVWDRQGQIYPLAPGAGGVRGELPPSGVLQTDKTIGQYQLLGSHQGVFDAWQAVPGVDMAGMGGSN